MLRSELMNHRAVDGASLICANDAAPPVEIPPGHVGPVVLPGTGRVIWWTGRVAIGLRHQPTRNFGPITQSANWIQSVLLRQPSRELAAA